MIRHRIVCLNKRAYVTKPNFLSNQARLVDQGQISQLEWNLRTGMHTISGANLVSEGRKQLALYPFSRSRYQNSLILGLLPLPRIPAMTSPSMQTISSYATHRLHIFLPHFQRHYELKVCIANVTENYHEALP